jgi:hypothetical protein
LLLSLCFCRFAFVALLLSLCFCRFAFVALLLSLCLNPDPPKLDGRLPLVAGRSRGVVLEEFVESLPEDDVPKLWSADEIRRHMSLVSLE